ncbi:hypothetical protein GCM10023086_18570 [Streptomyces venetus]|uniref:Uncharacterized protein n=1 Tax=Streptomyces venetus TaxID=1701086 RepID=A0ABP8FFM7_9ACTN
MLQITRSRLGRVSGGPGRGSAGSPADRVAARPGLSGPGPRLGEFPADPVELRPVPGGSGRAATGPRRIRSNRDYRDPVPGGTDPVAEDCHRQSQPSFAFCAFTTAAGSLASPGRSWTMAPPSTEK